MKFGPIAAACLSLALSSVAFAQTTMKISISTAQNSHQGVAIDTFAKEVEKRTGGRYKVQTFYNGSLGGERESIEAVQLGTQELAFSSTGPVPNFVPETKILDVPFLFRDKAHARAVLDGPIGQDLLTKFDAKGFKALAWAENGFRHMTNSKRDVKAPEDLKGLKMRTMENPVHIAAYKGFGIITMPMAFPEVFTALQQGTVDGQENPLPTIMAKKFYEVQSHIMLTGHITESLLTILGSHVWAKLNDDEKKIFNEVLIQAAANATDQIRASEQKLADEFRKLGNNVVEVDRAAFRAAALPLHNDGSGGWSQAEYDALQALK